MDEAGREQSFDEIRTGLSLVNIHRLAEALGVEAGELFGSRPPDGMATVK